MSLLPSTMANMDILIERGCLNWLTVRIVTFTSLVKGFKNACILFETANFGFFSQLGQTAGREKSETNTKAVKWV